MKNNSGIFNLSKGAMFIIAGILLSLFPGLISGAFYILGALIISFSVVSILTNPISTSKSIVGIIIGALVIILPKLLHAGIPLVVGIIAGWQAFHYISAAIAKWKSGSKISFELIAGALLAVAALIMITHPNGSGNFMRFLLGLVLVGIGVFNISIDKKQGDIQQKVIDVDAKSVD